MQHRSIGNALQVFSAMGGLALLAQHLPTVYPELSRPPSAEKASTAEQPDTDWVKVSNANLLVELQLHNNRFFSLIVLVFL